MHRLKESRNAGKLHRAFLVLLLTSGAAFLYAMVAGADDKKIADPLSASQVLQPVDLARELAGAKDSVRPTIVYVGFRTLFLGGHIPGASFHGTASTEQGLAEFKQWAAALPRSTNLVIYCGCCPFDRCPNIRPAYTTLHEMGFMHLRVLVLPQNFAADWVDKGYPVQKGL
jgi:thiosulfate/3-mercaptopyruvate sulfurtransferase